MKVYASKVRLNYVGYDSYGNYYGPDRWTVLYEVRIETEDYPLGSSEVVRVESGEGARERAIKKALPSIKKRLTQLDIRC